MDFSNANTALWHPLIQFGIIAGLILLANVLRRKVSFIRNALMPTAVIAGFILLLIKQLNILLISTDFLEMLTYHALAFGFIALSLRVPTGKKDGGTHIASRSGALIVSTYLVQAALGLIISLLLAYTVMPDLFKASGILLPMAYGQGPGQANNVGTTYEALGMTGGRSFGLSLAAAGYLCACVVGVVFLNVFNKKGFIKRTDNREEVSGSVTIDTFQDEDEIPISESVDKLSVQVALVVIVYLITYLLTVGITTLISSIAPDAGNTVATLLWGFNFIIGSMVASLFRVCFKQLKNHKIMSRQYQNNYLLSRISGLAFDIMIVAGIAGIDIKDLTGYWLVFTIMAVLGGIVTFIYLWVVCKKLYPGYFYESFFSMYGMLTGTISSGVLLLREIDPELETPASDNLVSGSSFGIVFGFPVLLLVSYATKDTVAVWITLLLVFLYLAALLFYMFKLGDKAQKGNNK